MQYIAAIKVMPLKELLDPQGKAARRSLSNLGLSDVEDVRIGKSIELVINAVDEAAAHAAAKQACEQLLVNPIMEAYTYDLSVIA